MEQPPISRATSAMVFNDMVNSNIRGKDSERTRLVESSGVVDACVRWVAELRTLGIPIFWVRVERRADGKDRASVLTDEFIAAGCTYPRPHVRGSFEAQNIAELPVQPEDHEILKPRFSPFAGTDLDIQLRARRIDTILLGGISTYSGVEGCARDAWDLDYNVVVLRDLCWGPDPQQHEGALAKRLPRVARVMTTEQARGLLL